MHSPLFFLIFISFSSIYALADGPDFAVYLCSMNIVNEVLTFAGDAVTGLLTPANTYPCGGAGFANGNGTLNAQGAITVVGNFLFVVNPGSNSITQFLIDAVDATVLTLIATVNTGGLWPTSCGGYSNGDKNVICAVNSGAINGVRCFNFNSTGMQVIDGADRLFDLALTTPPAILTGLSQLVFLLDGSAFVILNQAGVTPLLMYTFDLVTCLPGLDAILAPVLGGSALNFGAVIDPVDGALVVVDSLGARIVSITHGLTALLPSLFPLRLPGVGPCWIEQSVATGLFYVADALTGTICQVSRGLLGLLNLDVVIDLGLDLDVGVNVNALADLVSVSVQVGAGFNSFLFANCPSSQNIIGLTLQVGGQPRVHGSCGTGSSSNHATGMCSYVPPTGK